VPTDEEKFQQWMHQIFINKDKYGSDLIIPMSIKITSSKYIPPGNIIEIPVFKEHLFFN
jgi:hypothetical protein